MGNVQNGQTVQRLITIIILLISTSVAFSSNSSASVTVLGEVCSEDTGIPINNALIRVAVPATDMRMVRMQTNHSIYQTNTNDEGNFSIVVPLDDANNISVDVLAQGFRSAAGTYCSGGIFSLYKIAIKDDRQINLSIKLPKALYIAGTVRDNSGKVISDVKIQGRIMSENSYADIASTDSDKNGRFELFDFPATKDPNETSVLQFWHPQFEAFVLSNIYEKSQNDLMLLEVVMSRGLKVTGVLLNPSDKPVANTRIEAMPCLGIVVKSCVTDSNGHFELAGLKQGLIILNAIAADANQKALKEIIPFQKDADVILKLQQVELERDIRAVTLLGMQVADATPALKKLYDLPDIATVVVLAPGPNHERLGIGRLEKGYSFYIVGDKKISNIKEMISEILRINALPKPPASQKGYEGYHGFVRVVYLTRSGTNTQYLRLSDEDAKQLREVGKEIGVPQEKLY